ncbi:putative Ig domain-containing protein [Luteolibacter soli]|uniref:Alpha-galactosidase n=1 Tax=Luteolibacter soli TaxID=3135280 RepID=A0ABU9B2T0_9BACT
MTLPRLSAIAIVALGSMLLAHTSTLRAAEIDRSLILTPPAPETPRINGPDTFGVRPGSPFLYTIPASGKAPLDYAASGLPPGLQLDPRTGRITGVLKEEGTHTITLAARNTLGSSKKTFKIVVGSQLALTPPMGWSSWNCWGASVSQEKVLGSAKAIVDRGLQAHGWTYVNIDDGWQGKRGGKLNAIQPNYKFPDMAGLGRELHAMGLKFGIYSSPWQGTYAGFIGSSSPNKNGTCDWIEAGDHNEFYRISTEHEAPRPKKLSIRKFGEFPFVTNDVSQWSEWGVDYLKYDWHPLDVPHVEEMTKALRKTDRDIIYSLSNGADHKFANDYQRLSNLWRTTGDIRDNWQRLKDIGFSQDKWAPHGGPGHWNDPDMMILGMVGIDEAMHPTRLTPDEQYTHVSLWCLLSAPLLIGCDLAQLDDFTCSLLTNDEVLAIDQDALGKSATRVNGEGDLAVYAKPLEDGSIAVGLFNLSPTEAVITARWEDLKLGKDQQMTARDLWRQQDLGTFTAKFEAKVASHGVVLVKLVPR